MSKKQAYFIVISSVILSLAANVLFGRVLVAKISTIPVLNRWKLISPQAPIVINTREEVRVSDTGDVMQVINAAKSRTSVVAVKNAGQITVAGNAINLTSDGLFLTTKSVIGNNKADSLLIKLDGDGVGQVQQIIMDPATNLVILKTNLNNVQVANIAETKSLAVGQKVVFLAASPNDYSPFFQNSYVTSAQQNDYSKPKDADHPSRTFAVQGVTQAIPGQALININGDVAGIWDGSAIISGDVIRNLISGYISNKGVVARPQFGFGYVMVSNLEAKALNEPTGAKITSVDLGGAAQKAGLAQGDIVISLDGAAIYGSNSLEEILQKYKPGDKIKVAVSRGSQTLNLNLVAGELK